MEKTMTRQEQEHAESGMLFELTAEQQEFVDTFGSFCQKEIAPRSYEFDQAGQVPPEIFKKLALNGYTSLMFEPADGGQGASIFEATLAQIELARACGSTFFTVGASVGLFGKAVASYGTDEQKKKYLPAVINGEKVGALGITEPGAGSDVAALTCEARKVDDGYILKGQKTYITNAPICDYAVILARLIDENGESKGLTHFLVEADTPGFSRGKSMHKMGLNASPTGEIFLDDCRVGRDALLGGVGKGFRQTMETFNYERLALAAYSVGTMAACLEESKRYAKTRKSFGAPISKHQHVAFMLADLQTMYDASRFLLYKTALDADEHLQAGGRMATLNEQCAVVKLLTSTHARECTNLAVQLHGGAGYIEEYKVSRLYRDIKLAEIGGGTSEIQMNIIARSLEKKY